MSQYDGPATANHAANGTAEPATALKRWRANAARTQYMTMPIAPKIIASVCSRASADVLVRTMTVSDARAIDGAAEKRPAKLFGGTLSPISAKSATKGPRRGAWRR
jgi:hypothetical protein